MFIHDLGTPMRQQMVFFIIFLFGGDGFYANISLIFFSFFKEPIGENIFFLPHRVLLNSFSWPRKFSSSLSTQTSSYILIGQTLGCYF